MIEIKTDSRFEFESSDSGCSDELELLDMTLLGNTLCRKMPRTDEEIGSLESWESSSGDESEDSDFLNLDLIE